MDLERKPARDEAGEDSSVYQQRVLRDTLLPPLTGLLIGVAVGLLLAVTQVAEADLVLLIGGGAAIGAVGGVLLGASRGFRLRPPND